MRISIGILASATTLFAFGAAGLLGTWSLVAATIIGLIGTIATVTIMEEREHADALVLSLADRRRPLPTDVAADALDTLGPV